MKKSSSDTVAAVAELVKAVSYAAKTFGISSNRIWWRGHASDNWDLQASVHRPEYDGHERSLALSFIRKTKTRAKAWPEEDQKPEWLILMRHYGLPARLLDWTESVLVASFFAVSGPESENEDGALWALDPYHLNRSEMKTDDSVIYDCYDKRISPLLYEAFHSTEPSAEVPDISDKILAVNMPENHNRMLVQRAAFTVHGRADPLNKQPYVIKFRVPASAKTTIKNQLTDLGYTVGKLFPDLEHLVQELKDNLSSSPVVGCSQGGNRPASEVP